MTFSSDKVPGISGIAGGIILIVALVLAAVYEQPRTGNLWIALCASFLMIVFGAMSLRSNRREKDDGKGLGRGSPSS